MKILKDTIHFFRREPRWAFLLAAVLVLLGLVQLRPQKSEENRRPHAALHKFEQAENKLKDAIKSTGGIDKYLEKRPALQWIFGILILAVVAAFLAGLAIDFLWFSRPQFRKRILSSAGPPEARNWGFSTILKTILLFIVGSMGISLVLALLKSWVLKEADSNFLILVHTTLSDILCIGLVIYFITRWGGSWRDLGFKGVRFWKDAGMGVAGYLAILPLFVLALVILLVVIQLFSVEPPPHPLVEVFLEEVNSPGVTAYSIFLACVAGPIFEEIFFRGFCYPAMKKRWGARWALVLSSAFFSAIHQNLFAFVPVFILGLCLGYLYEKRGTLVPSIALHILHNSVFILYFFLAKDILTRGS